MRQQLVGMISAKNVLKEPKTALNPPPLTVVRKYEFYATIVKTV